MERAWSDYQKAIFFEIENPTRHVIVDALAGSGKTTVIVEGVKRVPPHEKVAVVCFNVSIKKELEARGVPAKTVNGLGHGAVMNALRRSTAPVLDRDKTRIKIKAVFGEDRYLMKLYYSAVNKLVGLAKAHGIVPDHPLLRGTEAVGLVPEVYPDTWFDLMDRYDIVLEHDGADETEAIDLARQVLARCILDLSIIDFDDQIYLPVIFNWPVPQHDRLFVDETQDLTLVQQELIARAVKKQLVAVGDPNQAIYGWRGAASNSMDLLEERFSAKRLPLSICYRCAKSIVTMAQGWVPEIEAAENAIEGSIEALDKWNYQTFEQGDMVICRNNAPLVSLAYGLMRNRVKMRFLGRDFARGLTAILTKLHEKYDRIGGGKPEMEWLVDALDSWREIETQKARARDQEEKAARISDQHATLAVFIDGGEADTIRGIIQEVNSLFDTEDEKGNLLTLSSIHRAKGREAKRVHILDWDLCPSRYATSEEAQQQEANVQYVAVTRAKEELKFIYTDGNED